ncbi:MAG: hypothetical protein PHW38_05970 [Candidatus Cloacimonetes bacterium]|jgi:hypothetical protein
MADNDSTLQGLNAIGTIALEDLLLLADASDSYVTKKGTVQKLMNILMSANGAFSLEDNKLKLSNNLDANYKKIINVANGTSSGDVINYEQIKHMIMGLEGISPSIPTIQDKGLMYRVSTIAINVPKGGFYIFYWCIDQNPNTTITIQNGIPRASSSVTVFAEGSVINNIYIYQEEEWINKYLHCVVQYRNIENESALSETGHYHIINPGWWDIINSHPWKVENMSMSILGNIIYITADKPSDIAYGTVCALRLLFNDNSDTKIIGNEEGLINMYAADPIFTYDIPLTKGNYQFVHSRIDTIALNGRIANSMTLTQPISLDVNLISDSLMNYLADRMVEKLKIDNGEIIRK